MANIYSYPQIGELADADNLIISDASNGNRTKSVTIEQLSDYLGTSDLDVDNYVNGGSYSSGTLTLTRTGSLPDIDISGFFNGQYSSLTGAPTLATVATSGSYNDLSNKPTIPAAYTNADVDAHLNTSTATAFQILSWTGSDYDWVAGSSVGTDNYVDGGSINGDTLTLTRTGLGDVDITGFLELGTTSTTALAGDTAVGQVQSITTNGTSGAATLVNGTLNIPQYSSGGGGAYTTLTRTLTGSEIVNAFNGNLSDSITLVSVPAGKLGIIREVVYIIKGATTGTTNYNANSSLYVLPQGAQNPNAPGWAVQISDLYFNSGFDWVGCNIDTGANSNLSDRGGTGADIILGVATGGTPVNITQGDRDVVISLTYRILDF